MNEATSQSGKLLLQAMASRLEVKIVKTLNKYPVRAKQTQSYDLFRADFEKYEGLEEEVYPLLWASFGKTAAK